MIDTLIENIKKKINLSLDETEQLFDKIFNGEVDTSSLTSLLDALDKNCLLYTSDAADEV